MKRPFGKFLADTFFARKTTDKFLNIDLAGKLVVFTGGTDGIGRVAVERFAEMGADICLLGRNINKTESVISDLKRAGYKGQFTLVTCDVGDLGQVRSAACEVLQRFERIDYLINCAGVNASERRLTADGFEVNLAVNYLGPFLLTELLLNRIKGTPNARIIQLTSATQEVAKLYLDDLQHEKNSWSLLSSYAQAKLCLIMHSRNVAARLKGSTATINCLNPGYIKSNLGRDAKGAERFFNVLFGRLAASTWVGAERIVLAALDSIYANVSGKFIYEDMLLDPNPIALKNEKVVSLMRMSRQLTGLAESDEIEQVSA